MTRISFLNLLEIINIIFLGMIMVITISNRSQFDSRRARLYMFLYFFTFFLEAIDYLLPKGILNFYEFSFCDVFTFLFFIEVFKLPKVHSYGIVGFSIGVNLLYSKEYDVVLTAADLLFNFGYLLFFLWILWNKVARASKRFIVLNRNFILFLTVYLVGTFIFYSLVIAETLLLGFKDGDFYYFDIAYSSAQLLVFLWSFQFLIFQKPLLFFRLPRFIAPAAEFRNTVEKVVKTCPKEYREFQRIVHQIKREHLFKNSKLSIRDLATTVGVHSKYLSKLINQFTEGNFNDFVNRFRVDYFKEGVDATTYKNFSILGMAQDAGFNSKSTFYKAFKKFENCSPSEYIKSKAA
ncbi:membrane hypothetical protein [Tenacibaculum litopenaei]|uniref:helix-turn-helix domain-containing protein n=1 Tax=Tenacibaculum litopenaei TaxID=396016 RepID=UPI00389332C4